METTSERIAEAIQAKMVETDGLPTHIYVHFPAAPGDLDEAAEASQAWVRDITRDDDGVGVMLGLR